MKWLIKPIRLEHEKIQLLIRMLTIAEIPFDIVHTLNGVIYDENKIIYQLDDNENYFVCGSYQLANAVGKTHSEACFTLDDYNFKDWYDIFGKENMLNENVQIVKHKDINWTDEEMFVRPFLDSKDFNGGIYNKATLEKIYTENSLSDDVICIVAPLQQIQKEFRFFVLNGEVIGSSQYKMNGELFPSNIVDYDAINFAQEMIKKFDFLGYVIDIATNNGQCKIVELNCFNASGFYEIDLWNFVKKVTDYYDGNLEKNIKRRRLC